MDLIPRRGNPWRIFPGIPALSGTSQTNGAARHSVATSPQTMVEVEEEEEFVGHKGRSSHRGGTPGVIFAGTPPPPPPGQRPSGPTAPTTFEVLGGGGFRSVGPGAATAPKGVSLMNFF